MLLAAWYHPVLATLFAFLALLLMGVILLQRGRGVGLAGAFGGAGGQTAFGSKTGDFLTWATIVVAVGLLVFAIALNYVFKPERAPLGAPPPAPAGGEDTGSTAAPKPGLDLLDVPRADYANLGVFGEPGA